MTLDFPLLFLIGYRGTGKSTVAQLLAQRLGWDWVDADATLETQHGRSVRDIFAEEGEAPFRDKEEAVLDALCGLERRVIATGGGVILRKANRDRLSAAGKVVWLTADADTIQRRLQADPTTPVRRPALTVGGQAEIEEALRSREPLYRACANLTVATEGRTPETVAELILDMIAPSRSEGPPGSAPPGGSAIRTGR
jgi:shikimate kinase